MNSFSPTILTDLEKLIYELKDQISREASQENVLTRIRIVSLSDMERRLQDIRRLTSRQRIRGWFKEAATKRKVKSFPTPSVSSGLSSFQSA